MCRQWPSGLQLRTAAFPPFHKTCSCLAVLRHGVVSRADWSFPHLLHAASGLYRHFLLKNILRMSLRFGGYGRKTLRAPLHNYAAFSMPSYITCSKGITANLYGGKYRLHGAFGLRWLFESYCFLVQLLATSLEDGRKYSSRMLYRTNTIPISTTLRFRKYHISYTGFRIDFCCLLQGEFK